MLNAPNLAAESVGLGCCPISVMRNQVDLVARTLGLPEKVFPAAGLDASDRAREARHPTPAEKQRAPDRFGYADRYGWSEDKARQVAQPEGAAFPPWLRAHGFTFD